jgi:hypothetical protein
MEDIEQDELYQGVDDIDFSVITHGFRQLVLFDDMYLNMQGMNIGVIDSVITTSEYELLREYFRIERTPFEDAIVVSAISQMWIFSLYELLRTWRNRIHKLKRWQENGGLNLFIDKCQESEDKEMNLPKMILMQHAERMRDDTSFGLLLDKHKAELDGVFHLTESIRINLAKHEAPGKKNLIPPAPGYGRINMICGAMDYEILHADETYSIANRRDLADLLRKSLLRIIDY